MKKNVTKKMLTDYLKIKEQIKKQTKEMREIEQALKTKGSFSKHGYSVIVDTAKRETLSAKRISEEAPEVMSLIEKLKLFNVSEYKTLKVKKVS